MSGGKESPLQAQGIALLKERDYSEALRVLLLAAAESAVTPELLFHTGLCYANLAENEKAIEALEQSLAGLLPEELQQQAFAVLGVMYGQASAFEQSRHYFEMLLGLDAESVVAYAGIGYAAYRVGDYEQAKEMTEKGLELAPDNANLLNSLGCIYLDSDGDLDKALELCEKALSHDRGNGAIADSLAQIWDRKGDRAKAEEYITRARQLLPHHPEVARHYRSITGA